MYETHWTGLSTSSWEQEMDLQLSRHEILCYCTGAPNRHRHTNRLYHRMRTGAAQRERSLSSREHLLASGYCCVPHADWFHRYSATLLPNRVHLWYKGDDGLSWLGKISASTTTNGVYLVSFLDDPGPIKPPLSPVRYTTSTGAVRGSSCLQVHLASAFARGVQHNVDESRGAAMDR